MALDMLLGEKAFSKLEILACHDNVLQKHLLLISVGQLMMTLLKPFTDFMIHLFLPKGKVYGNL